MKPNEIKARLEQLEGYSKTLVQAMRVLDERRHILQPLLEDTEVKDALAKKLENSIGGHAYNHLVPWFAQDLVRDLTRLFLDQDRRSGSLVNLYRKSSDPKVLNALKEQFRSIPDKWYKDGDGIGDLPKEMAEEVLTKMHKNHCDDFEKSFEKDWDEVATAVANLEADPVSDKLKTFRDKYHAHLEMSPLGQDPTPFDVGSLGLTYNDILAFIDRFMWVPFEINRMISGTVYSVDEFSALHRQYGSAMWRALGGLKVRES